MQKNDDAFKAWINELIRVTGEEIGEPETAIKINMSEARKWFDDGFTPYQTFRETFNNEDDCGFYTKINTNCMELSKYKKIIAETPEHVKRIVKLEMDLLDAKDEIEKLKQEKKKPLHGKLHGKKNVQ
jgi:hypothetical protein